MSVHRRRPAAFLGALFASVAFCTALAPAYLRAQGDSLSPERSREIAAHNEQLGFRGVIAGQVTFENGESAAGFRVTARYVVHQSGLRGEGEAVTDSDGRYEIRGLNSVRHTFREGPDGKVEAIPMPQGFWVQVDNGGKPFVAPPPRRIVLTDRADKVDFILRVGPRITVRVRDAESLLPIPGMVVEATRYPDHAPDTVGVTDHRGEAWFRSGLLDFKLRVRAPDSLRNRIGPAPGHKFYRDMRLSEIRPLTWDVLAYENPHQMVRATLRGVVSDSDGKPVPLAVVSLTRQSEYMEALTDAAGYFSFPTTRISEHEHNNWGILLRASKGGIKIVKFPTAEETWSLIPIRLIKASETSLNGLVVDHRGRPQPNVPIAYFEAFTSSAQQAVYAQSGGATDTKGRFRLTGLHPEAGYALHLGGTKYVGGVLHSFSKVEYPKPRSGWLRLRSGEQRDLGRFVVPTADAVIAGRVMDHEGKPLGAPLYIVIRGPHTSMPVQVDAEGRFQSLPVVREALTLSIYASPDNTRSWNISPDSPDLVYSGPARAGDTDVRITVRPRPAVKK